MGGCAGKWIIVLPEDGVYNTLLLCRRIGNVDCCEAIRKDIVASILSNKFLVKNLISIWRESVDRIPFVSHLALWFITTVL